jgi:anti-sigma B factor antagonist
MAEFRATVRRRDAACVVDLHGQIDMGADGPLGAAYAEAAAQGPGPIVLNFEHVDYINSTGIALIVGLLARARTERRSISACGLIDHYREIFQITRLSDFMEIHPDEDSAAGAPAAAGNTGRQS